MATRYRIEGFPRGWFMVLFSDELAVGAMHKMKYFGRSLMAWRGEDGVARIMDAHCPHLGANIAAGGKVEGNTVVCPFHLWRFDTLGQCVEIPYCDGPISKKATLGSWPVIERNGMIFVWHHPEGEGPDFDVPSLPNDGSSEWTPWRHHVLRIKTHSKEIVENVVDLAHFMPVHGTHVETFVNEFDGHKAIQRTKGTAYPRGGGKDRFELDAIYYGPGYQISDMRGYLHSLLVNAHTMIDEHTLDLRFGVSLKPRGSSEHNDAFAEAYIKNLTTGFLEDVEIWENKVYRDTPLLARSDGPIMKLRRWYAQFYTQDGPRGASATGLQPGGPWQVGRLQSGAAPVDEEEE